MSLDLGCAALAIAQELVRVVVYKGSQSDQQLSLHLIWYTGRI